MKLKRVSPASFFAVSHASPLASQEKQLRSVSMARSSISAATTASPIIEDIKSSTSPWDEKTKAKFLALQDRLITACEKGNLAAVKKAIHKGAQVDQANAKGKWPLYAAVYGMNPELVRYVIAQLTEETPINLQACEEHNKNHYGQTFLNMRFAPESYEHWYDLLLKIEPNGYLAGYHLAQCEGWWAPRLLADGFSGMMCVVRDRMAPLTVRRSKWYILLHGDLEKPFCPGYRWKTEAWFEVNRNQIKQAMEALQEAQTKQGSVKLLHNHFVTLKRLQ